MILRDPTSRSEAHSHHENEEKSIAGRRERLISAVPTD